jgi:hypothetical protein
MLTDICTCEKCSSSGNCEIDPRTGLSIPGRVVGRKEFLEHRRLQKIKQSLHDATDDPDDASSQSDSHSRKHSISSISELQEDSGLFVFIASVSPVAHDLRTV